MPDKYSPAERLKLILAGEKPDRFAASFWRHFFDREHDARGTAEAMLAFQKMFRWDFMKINPRADYHTQDWGLKLHYSTHELQKHVKADFPVTKPEDWTRITPLPLTAPVLDEHLRTVALIRKGSDRELPLLMTIFTPLSVAGRLVPERQMLVDHLESHPHLVEQALAAITDTFTRFATELRNAGADGIFYATTHWASADKLTWEQYEQFGLPYDLPVIEAAGKDALNILHVCSTSNYLSRLVEHDYKTRMVNWDHSHPTNLPLDRAAEELPGWTLVGGVDHEGWLRHSSPQEIAFQIQRLKSQFDPARLIIAPGCAVDPSVPMDAYRAIRESL
jgi:uroporphyrinogen decarboxylase